MSWVLVLAGVAAVIAFGALTSAQLRRGGTAPGPMVSGDPVSGHDEPEEDTARVVDRPRHRTERTADAERDVGRTLGH